MKQVGQQIKETMEQLTTKNTTLGSEEKQKAEFKPPKVLKEYVCQGCGYHVKKTEMTIIGGQEKGKRQVFEMGCKCEEKRIGDEIGKNVKIARAKRMKAIFDEKSLIPKKLKDCTFENYDPKNESQKQALQTALEYVEGFDPKESDNLLFSGSYGIGKSHLCVSICKTIMNKGFSSIFISVPKLLTKIKSTYNNNEVTEDDILTTLEEVDLLVLDDIGAENDTDWAVSKLFEIVDNRQGKHTLYTTNMNSTKLNGHIGDRNFSRVMYDTKPLKMEGEDQRIQHF